MDYSPPGSSVHGISQARILEWVAISFSMAYSRSRDQTHVPCIGRKVLYHWATRKTPLHSFPMSLAFFFFLRFHVQVRSQLSFSEFLKCISFRQLLYTFKVIIDTAFVSICPIFCSLKQRRTKEPLDESERGDWKSWLKTQHLEN